jgi:hypothetical protein
MPEIVVDFAQYLENSRKVGVENPEAAVAAKIRDATPEEVERAERVQDWGYLAALENFDGIDCKVLVVQADGRLLRDRPPPPPTVLPRIAQTASCC